MFPLYKHIVALFVYSYGFFTRFSAGSHPRVDQLSVRLFSSIQANESASELCPRIEEFQLLQRSQFPLGKCSDRPRNHISFVREAEERKLFVSRMLSLSFFDLVHLHDADQFDKHKLHLFKRQVRHNYFAREFQ